MCMHSDICRLVKALYHFLACESFYASPVLSSSISIDIYICPKPSVPSDSRYTQKDIVMLRRLTTSAQQSLGFRLPIAAASTSLRFTTILCVKKGDEVVLIGDRQVTLGERIVAKSSACKLRRLNERKVAVGFAGSTADAFALMEKLETKLNDFPDQLARAAVELAKDWRTDKALRRLEASLIVCNAEEVLEIDGQGNVITPEEDGIIAIGSGGTYAKAAARALIDVDGFDAESIARKAMKIATDIDVFSNGSWDMEKIKKEDAEGSSEEEGSKKAEAAKGTATKKTKGGDVVEAEM